MPTNNYDPSTRLYWFRKRDAHPDADVQKRAEECRDMVAIELGLRQPYPRIAWFQPEEYSNGRTAWTRDARGTPGAKWGIDDDPFSAPSMYFRFPCEGASPEFFCGFTPRDYTGLIGIAVAVERGSLFETIAHECKHVEQDERRSGWRMSNLCAAEEEADLFVERMRDRLRAFATPTS